ncbi:MAG: hypothetical protein M1835_000672 [Candelina submexicana]|nr:MAG: hypothetical protein M1835_000672 [Candelina submexicana]
MLSNAELFDFPARPPTPPKESGSNTETSPSNPLRELSNANLQVFAQVTACDTPPQCSPSSSAESDKPRKRVGFSPWTDYHKAPIFNGKATSTDSLLRQLPPSRERRSSKSILKPFGHLAPPAPGSVNGGPSGSLSAHRYSSFTEMLESVIQQLAGEDRNGRLDSYITLEGTLKAYDGIPDSKAMGTKMGLFMDFIRRDMGATMSGSIAIDTNLATHALKLLIILLWTPSLSESLTDEFRIFIVDHSINALEDLRVPKALVSHHMHLLSQQDFSAKVMNTDRSNRLISALDKIEEHVKGNSILGERLLIYQKLIRQARGAMIIRVGDWLDHLFSAMLSSIKEIRVRAIGLGIDGGLSLGTSSQASRAVMDIFNRELDGGNFFEYLSERLNKMMPNKEEAMHIPQIWSVVILFLRSRPHQLEQWQYFKGWLNIIQKCFNTGDIAAKFQANIAWNRFIFAIGLGSDLRVPMMKLLRQPITGQLDRRANDSYSRKARIVAFASYCNLLYYSLRPASSFQHLDFFWEEYVSHVLQRSLARSEEDIKLGCQILIALLDSTQSKVWNENRANELAPVKPEELPRLDPRWVRSRAHILLNEVELALNHASWDADLGTEAPVRILWRNFMGSIANAGSKEVKMSSELIAAIARIFNMLRRAWVGGTPTWGMSKEDSVGSHMLLERFGFLITTSIDHLGPVHFTERVLTRDSQSLYEAASTPSSRSSRTLDAPRSPLLYLLELLLLKRRAFEDTQMLYTIFTDVLKRCYNSRSSRRMRLELLRESAQMLLELSSRASDASLSRCWEAIAELTEASITESTLESPKDSSQQLGHEYREFVKILDAGVKLQSVEQSNAWAALYDTFAAHVKQEMGDGGLVLAVVEPLADTLWSEHRSPSSNIIPYASTVLDKASFPKNQKSLDLGHKRLWDVVPFSKKTAVFKPFNHLYQMIDNLLIVSYRDYQFSDWDYLVGLFASLTAFLHRCPLSLLVNSLKRIQYGIGLWLEDAESRIKSGNSKLRGLGIAITGLWTNIITMLKSLNHSDSVLLQALETLIACGLGSSRRVILTASVEYWNSSFGHEANIEYPPKVRSALGKLKSIAELQLPTFPKSAEDEVADTPIQFSDTQDDSEPPEKDLSGVSSGFNRLKAPATPQLRSASPAQGRLAAQPFVAARSRHSTPEPHSKTNPSRKFSTARLRHDDSQIVFATINSSPLDTSAMESQLMTDRQREVRDRQQAEAAAMFPDIRSSPKMKHAHSKADLPPLTLSSDRPSTGELVVDGPMTPTLPPTHMEGFLGSSPTPRPGNSDITQPSSPPLPRVVPAELSYDYPDIPSSPPQATALTKSSRAHQNSHEVSRVEDSQIQGPHTDLVISDGDTNPRSNEQGHESELAGLISHIKAVDDPGLSVINDADRITITQFSDQTSFAKDKENCYQSHVVDTQPQNTSIPCDPSRRLKSLSDQEMANSEVFIDALSSPLEPSDAQDQGDEVFVDASQSPLRTTNGLSEGINPRLTTAVVSEDMSGASSPLQDDFSRALDSMYDNSSEQATPRQNCSGRAVSFDETENPMQELRRESVAESRTSSQGSRTKKRKRVSRKAPKKRGRPRLSTSEAGSQSDIIKEAPQDDVIYDCIVVDNSQVTASPAPSPTGVEAEQSPSPVKGTQDPFSPPFRVVVRRPSISDFATSRPSISKMSPRSRKRSASVPADTENGGGTQVDSSNDLSHMAPSATQTKRRKSSRLSQVSTASLIEDCPGKGFASSTSMVDNDSTALPEKNDEEQLVSLLPETTAAQTTPDSQHVATSYNNTCPDTDQALEDQINAEITSSRSRAKASRPAGIVDSPTKRLQPSEGQEAEKPTASEGTNQNSLPQQIVQHMSEHEANLSDGEKLRSVSPTDVGPAIAPRPDSTIVYDDAVEKPKARGIIDKLKETLQDLRQAALDRDELRELDDVLFEVRTEAHQASTRKCD